MSIRRNRPKLFQSNPNQRSPNDKIKQPDDFQGQLYLIYGSLSKVKFSCLGPCFSNYTRKVDNTGYAYTLLRYLLT